MENVRGRNATKAQLSAQEEPPGGGKEWGEIMMNLCRDVQEWTLPSWKVGPKYSTKVLIGNWGEERRRFVCDNEGTVQSTFKQDFVPFPTGTPDRTVMRRLMKRLETHWEEARHQHLVSQYDDQYNRHGHNPQLPPLRKWHRHKLAWTPEKSDYPLCEPPTNDGLVEHLMKAWHRKETEVAQTVYHTSYPKPPAPGASWNRAARPPPAQIKLPGHPGDVIVLFPEGGAQQLD
ncbi:cilia- and flagella-associated protein 107-like [Vipera latastei]